MLLLLLGEMLEKPLEMKSFVIWSDGSVPK